jgi:hypothetical protein
MTIANRFLRPLLAASAILAVGGLPLALHAQETAPAPSQAAPQSVSDADIESFAHAAQKVQAVATKYQGQLQSAGSDADKANIAKEEQQEMIGAIQGEGLTVERYQQVAEAVQKDPDLWNKVKQHLEGGQQ